MIPISEQDFSRLADAVRRRRQATCTPDAADALEQHAFRVMSYVDDLAEGESLNAMDYSILRAAAILHDVAAPKARPAAVPDSSAALAAEMLDSCGADSEFTAAVAEAVRRHAGTRALDVDSISDCEDLSTCPQMLVHDACLLARLDEARLLGDPAMRARMRLAEAALCTKTAQRMAAPILDAAERTFIAPAAF